MAKYPVLYSEELAEHIISEYIGGASLREISSQDGMPSYNTLLRWTKTHEIFRKELSAARETRALHFEEEAVRIGCKAEHIPKEDVPGSRLAFEAMSWAAEKADPVRFGKRTTIGGDASNPVKIIVQTGVPEPSQWQKPPELAADGTVILLEAEKVTEEGP